MDTSVEMVWSAFNSRLERFIRSRVSDSQAADDLLQDVYIRIHTRVDTLRDEERLQSWVYQVARNVVNDYYRQLKPLDEITDAVPAQDADDGATDDITERLAQSVRCMIEVLPDEYREALILTELEGLTQKELADRLGISLSGAKSRVQRGRKMLRELLLQCCHFQFDRRGKVIDYYPRCSCCADGGCVN
jgi:RNA polymerase sigma-70 factor (ECF subfamily)